MRTEALISVRLECVRHAASVHPEPGSNSRLECLYLSLAFALLITCLFRNFRDFSLSFRKFPYSLCALYFLFLLFDFQGSGAVLADSLTIIALCFPFVNPFFEKYFSFFVFSFFFAIFGSKEKTFYNFARQISLFS